MRECWVLEEHSKGDGWYPLRCAGSKEAAEAEMRAWPASTLYPKRVVRYVPAEGLAALHQELDWMLSSLSETDTAELSASILLRWRNTLAQVAGARSEAPRGAELAEGAGR